ncbi:MAG: hypothetical protein IKB72_01965 [Ruminococcus sp.]|nr:hypothetical protein [Ruminococcus sp.]
MKEKKTQVRRSLEERLAEVDKTIAYHKGCIKRLEARKKDMIDRANKPARKRQFKRLVADGNLTAELLCQKLGITPEALEAVLEEARNTPNK